MPLFGPKSKYEPGTEGPSLANSRSVTGGPVQPPEVIGGLARRGRMFGEVVRLAERGDVRDDLGSLLKNEASFVKWASLRGAVMYLSVALEAVSFEELRAFAEESPPPGLEQLVSTYSRLEKASMADVLSDPLLVGTNDWHLDIIAWCALCYVGGGLHHRVLNWPMPGAQALEHPGWYTDPIFAKAERFWDGTDWTSRMRFQEGRIWRAMHRPL